MSTEANESRKVDVGQPDATEVKRLVLNDQELKEIKKGWSTSEKAMGSVLLLGALAGLAVTANEMSKSPETSEENPDAVSPTVSGAENGTKEGGDITAKDTSPGNIEALEDQEVITGEAFTEQTYPYLVNGESFTSSQEAIEAISITTSEAPTIKEVGPQMAEFLENWINAGNTEVDYSNAQNIEYPYENEQENFDSVAGSMYTSVYLEAIFAENADNSVRTWRDDIWAIHTAQTEKWLESRSSNTPAEATVTLNFSSTYDINGENPLDPGFSALEAVSFIVDDGVEGSESQELTFMPKFVVDENGKWKISEVHEAQVLD